MPYQGKKLVGGYRPGPDLTIRKSARKSMPMARPESLGKRLYTGSNRDAQPVYPGRNPKIIKGS